MRSIWNGSISFGLVSIPVKLYSGSEDRKLDLDMLDRRDHGRIRYKRVNEDTGKEVEWKDIVKGFKKDVLTKIHGGGARDRKRKLLDKQKKGKTRAKQFGQVEIPQEAFIGVLKINKV